MVKMCTEVVVCYFDAVMFYLSLTIINRVYSTNVWLTQKADSWFSEPTLWSMLLVQISTKAFLKCNYLLLM